MTYFPADKFAEAVKDVYGDATTPEDQLARFVALEKERRELEQHLDRLKEEAAELGRTILDHWDAIGQQNARIGGLTVYVAGDFVCNKRSGVPTAAVCDALEGVGLGHLVAPAYSPASLKSWVKEQVDAGSDLPDELAKLISYDTILRLKSRSV